MFKTKSVKEQAPRAISWALLLSILALAGIATGATLVHVAQVLDHPYPLDYGEGPLMAQVNQLLLGTPLPQLYADPAQPPHLIINYPPVVLALASLLAWPLSAWGALQPALLAGRLLAVTATALAALALLQLARLTLPAPARRWPLLLTPALFLALSLVREWAVLFRVDMVALALALWSLVLALQAPQRRAAAVGAGLLGALCLLAKPSFVAAPAAATLWLLAVAPRRALLLAGVAACAGVAVLLVMELASGGWFIYHVIEANANEFSARLALKFWREHLELHWPLVLAGSIGLAVLAGHQRATAQTREARRRWLLPLLYTLFAVLSAVGVGKVGAYSNYFLEMDAALVWLAGAGLASAGLPAPRGIEQPEPEQARQPSRLRLLALLLLVLLQLARYHPLWNETRPRPAANDERRPRVLVGRYAIWRDLAHERDILQGRRRVQQAIAEQVREAGSTALLSDTPGTVVAAGGTLRLQVFEARQLLEQGLWRQDGLLHELANGEIPLLVLDWLGNWLSPEMVTIIRHRYALDGSLGGLSLYRPVEPGPYTSHPASATGGPALAGYHLLPPFGGAYRPAEQLAVTLRWQRGQLATSTGWKVTLRLVGQDGNQAASATAPLLYNTLPADSWPSGESLQQVVRLTVPQLAPGSYQLRLELRRDGAAILRERLRSLEVGPPLGRVFARTDYYVPAPILAAWRKAGGMGAAGLPITPPIPFAWGWLQCFERACFEKFTESSAIRQRPLGELLALPYPEAAQPTLAEPFRSFVEAHRQDWKLGEPVTPELREGPLIVQYLRYARLERPPKAHSLPSVGLGRLGAEHMRLNEWDRFILP